MNRKKKNKKEKIKRVKATKRIFGEITLTILDVICTIPEALAGAFLNQKGVIERINSSGEYRSLPVNYLNDLINRGYLERKTIEGQKSICLTHKGLIRKIEGDKSFIKDGKWRFLSFDIPENMKKVRDQFRRSIKRIGFRQVQKSLWGCPYIKADQIDLIIHELKIRKYVAYIVSDKTDIEPDLKKIFKDCK